MRVSLSKGALLCSSGGKAEGREAEKDLDTAVVLVRSRYQNV